MRFIIVEPKPPGYDSEKERDSIPKPFKELSDESIGQLANRLSAVERALVEHEEYGSSGHLEVEQVVLDAHPESFAREEVSAYFEFRVHKIKERNRMGQVLGRPKLLMFPIKENRIF